MHPVRAISINHGWKVLTSEHKDQWNEIESVIENLSIEKFIHYHSGRDGKVEIPYLSSDHITPDPLSFYARTLFYEKGWSTNGLISPTNSALTGPPDGYVTGSYKSKVAAEFISQSWMSYRALQRLILVEAPINFKNKLTNVSVIIVGVDDLAMRVLTVDGNLQQLIHYTENSCRNELQDIPVTANAGPIVMLFVAPYKQDLQIEEFENSDVKFIEREVQLPRDAYQSGVGLLSYFGEVLRQTHPETSIQVIIEQNNDTVILRVEVPQGKGATIRQQLEVYFDVLAGKQQPNKLLVNPYHALGLQARIDLADTELRISKQFNSQLVQDINRLESTQALFQKVIEQLNTTTQALTNVVGQQVVNQERTHLAQISFTASLFKELVADERDEKLKNAIKSIEANIIYNATANQVEIIDALNLLKDKRPGLLPSLFKLAENAGYGMAGNIGYELLKNATQ